ncbi:hypothetical protein ACQ0P8_05600 [Halodesulfovibrio aestuarii]|uniref:PEGA domain-containing protein n=1 Tax=Halodesulfovibrio aestuarii TaxID=126333 RepID=A0A8G2FAP7_9BACT|nr:hypothetical protein [Halodesulfovibrio aestuarii]SHI83475.1 hypothetical protein SAMN05660830_01145 [Halodesulfovibrio aestuarii]
MRRVQKIILLMFVCSIMALSVGCGRHTGITSPDQTAWLSFVGNTKGTAFVVDGGIPTVLSAHSENGGKLYQTTPGKHVIEVQRNNRVVVRRTVLIGGQQTKEIRVP